MKHDYPQHEHEHEHEHDYEHGHEHEHSHECDGAGHVHHHHQDGSCCCEHHENIHHGVNKLMIVRLAIAAVLFFSHEFVHFHEEWFELILFAAVALIAGYDVILAAFKNIFRLKFFDEYFLMTFAAIAAFIIGNYHEAAAVMFLYRIGETCQDCAIRYSRRKIASVTGQYAPIGEEGNSQRFITKFSRIYTPVILICALVIVILLPLLGNMSLRDAVYRALNFLVVACPCAIVISVPMAYFAGIAAAAGRGVFFHDTTVVDKVARGELDIDVRRGLASGLVIVGGEERFALAMSIASKARNIAIENIAFTLAVKLALVVLGLFGVSSLWFAVFADSGITIILALNALRAFSVRGKF